MQEGDLAAHERHARASALPATSMHEQLHAVSRLLELSERCDAIECGVPLCEECASSVLRELQRRLEAGHDEREKLQAAFAELEAGEDEASDASLSDAQFAHALEAQRRARFAAAAELKPRIPGPNTATMSPGPVSGISTAQRMPAPSGLKAVASTGSRLSGTGSNMASGAR